MSKPMPGRPEQHDLKTLSHRRVRALFPDRWTDEEVSEDYGIDLLVEIFTDGAPTGLRFGVQVKSTKKVKGSAKTSIRWATRNYWHTQDFPILVVLWDKATSTTWWEWSHRFDTSGLDGSKGKFQFKFPSGQVWEDDTPAEIEREVRARRAWEAPGAHLPLTVLVDDEVGTAGLAPRELTTALRTALAPFPTLLRLRATPTGPLYLSVAARRADVTVWMTGTTSGNLHYPQLAEPISSAERAARARSVAADVVLTIVDRLGEARLLAEAARIAASAVLSSTFIKAVPDLASKMVGLMGSQGRIREALELTGHLMDEGTPDAALAALGTLMSGTDEINEDEREQIVAWLLARADQVGATEPGLKKTRAAELTFNAGMFLGLRHPDRAADLLDRAATLDPGMAEYDHFHRSAGLFAFTAGKHSRAATHLQRASDLGATQTAGALGDAYLWDGQYERALECFQNAMADPEQANSDWRLKHLAISELTTRFGVKDQTRRVADAASAARTTSGLPQLTDILRLDLLCAEALHRYAGLTFRNNEPAATLLIAAALCRPLDPTRWVAALHGALRDQPSLVSDVLESAAHACDEDLVALLSMAGEPPEVLQAMQRAVDDARASSSSSRSIPWSDSDR